MLTEVQMDALKAPGSMMNPQYEVGKLIKIQLRASSEHARQRVDWSNVDRFYCSKEHICVFV